jgi:hypothetical protein
VVSDDLNTLMEEEILPHGDNAFGPNDPRPWSATDSRFDALPNVDRLVLDASEHASRAEQPTSDSRVDARSAAARRDRMGTRC